MQSLGEDERGPVVASILAIGTSNPPNFIYQDDYPDFYFRVTKSEHMTELKEKYKRMCAKSNIKKRHFLLSEETLKENPNIGSYGAPSLNARQHMLVNAIPELGKEAAIRAIQEWGQPVSAITHLVFVTFSCFMMPGADYQLTKLLGLNLNVKRVMIYNQGCFAGGTALRLAKDLAENNPGSRVLVVCSESNAMAFHAPSQTHLDALVGQAVLADGASAVIVAANPDPLLESGPIFEIVSASQAIVPDSEGSIVGHFLEMGMAYYLKKNCFSMFGEYLESYLVEHVLSPLGLRINNHHDWNSLFYAAHPGGSAVLDPIEEKLGLEKDKLRASRHVLREYGNMGSACVIFILDELRRKSIELNKATTGEGMEYGLLLGFGPGLTIETLVLRSVPIVSNSTIEE